MKTTITSLTLAFLAFSATAQVSETVLHEDFSSFPLANTLDFSPSVEDAYDNGFNNDYGVGEFILEDYNPSYGFSWSPLDPINSSVDSIEIEFKIGKSGYGQNTYNFTRSNGIDTIAIEKTSYIYIANVPYLAAVQTVLRGGFTKSTNEGDYLTLVNTFKKPFVSNELTAMDFHQSRNYLIQGNSGVYQGTLKNAAEGFCAAEGSLVDDCLTQVFSEFAFFSQSLNIDDIKVTSYSLVTGLDDKIMYNNKEVLAVYNSTGQPSSFDAVNEIIIVKYTDGTTERVFNVR